MNKFKQLLCLTTLCLPITILASSTSNDPNLGYQSAEHIFMGDQVVLQGLPKPPAHQLIELPLDNGLKLSYGDLVAMPDYYGDPDHQISSESTFEKRKEQFAKLFHSFSTYDVSYFHAFWPIVQKEQQEVAAALKAHQSVSDLYKRITGKEMIELNIATHGKYIKLAATCFDHFGSDAWLAYQAGHSVAVDTAIAGHDIAVGRNAQANSQCAQATDQYTCLMDAAQKDLEVAYEQNGYANHFLTDRLAAGHMRTPFRALSTTRPIPKLGGIAGGYMHDEDNQYGVVVTNSSGKYWMAYGDDYYFSDQNKAHRAIIKDVIQKSADEVYDAFSTGYNPDPMSAQLETLMAQPIDPGKKVVIDGSSVTQSAPLYKMVSGAVWERKNVNDRNDDQWVQHWSTIKLMLTYHLNKLPIYWQQYLKEHPQLAAILPHRFM